MKNPVFDDLNELLKKDERLVSQDGVLLKNQTQELARKNDPELIKLLLSDKVIKQNFFFEVEKALIFDKEKFIRFISNKQFLPDSYTTFKNKIGLTVGDEYLSENKEVVLTWPYKDCVLEGGMTKEDQKRDEIFYNEILAPDDINRLLDAKVFTNFKRIDKKGEHKLDGFNRDEKGIIKDNLIIKGNNLLALASLKKEFTGEVKLIYIDPPYNTGNDGFKYNDSFNHSSWLVFMKNRLEVAKQLLSNDGSIYIQLDYNEIHYCKILMDEVFGRDNFQREIIWDMTVLSGYKTLAQNWIRGHDSILFYTKNPNNFKFNKLMQSHTKEYEKMFNKTDKNGRKYMVAHGSTRYWDEIKDKGKPYGDVWNDIMSFQQQPTSGERMEFDGQKPEKLLDRIIRAATDEGDVVLDYHAGTGTTLAVAHKTRRQYIGIEQMDYIHDLPEARLKKVIAGEQGGVSKTVNWRGGGDFIYMELTKWNEAWIEKIEKAKTPTELTRLCCLLQEEAFLGYKVDPRTINSNIAVFADLSISDQKKFLMECLDKNQLYVNLSEIEDKEYGVSKENIKLNKEFYGQ